MSLADPRGLDPVATFDDTIDVVSSGFKFIFLPIRWPPVGGGGQRRPFSPPGGGGGGGGVTRQRQVEPPKKEWFGFGCDEVFNFASSVGLSGGHIFAGSIDVLVVWGNRVEITVTGGLGGGVGGTIAPFGGSYGKSRGFSVGGNASAGVGPGVFLSANSPSSKEDSGSVFLGLGAGGHPTLAAAAGGLAHTWVPYDVCK